MASDTRRDNERKGRVLSLKFSDYSREELLTYIQTLTNQKKFGLVWEEKPEQVAIDCEEKLPVLEQDLSRAIAKVDAINPHVIIEGDNYHSLSALNFTHSNSIDVIYIDPPYNTGEKDFVYNDRFVDKEDGYRHSKWLSFMSKRLVLAKNLLSDDGVIFISIDDNEQANLKLLCDQIFGEESFVGQFIHKNNSSKNQANLLSISTEYMLCYAKSIDALKGVKWRIPKKGAKDIAKTFSKLKAAGLSLDEISVEIKEMYSRPKYSHLSRWNKVDERGVFKDADLSREGGRKDYTIINPETNKEVQIPSRGWGKSYEELLRLQAEDLIWYGDENTPPGQKDYIESDREVVPDNFLYFDNSVDTRMIKTMFGSLVFENPKPLEMIKTILTIASKKDSIILDFFAGSGTTGHAVLELNKEDGGSRQFILCTNNENDIAESITYQRIKKVIEGYSGNPAVPSNLRYFTTAFVQKDLNDDKTRMELVEKSEGLICFREAAFDLKDKGTNYSIFSGPLSYVLVIYDQDAIHLAKEALSSLDRSKPLSIYVFSFSNDTYDSEFDDLNFEYRIRALPEIVLEVYRRLFPTKVSKSLETNV